MRWPLNNFIFSEGYTVHPPAADLDAPIGTDVKSPVTGVVIKVGRDKDYVGGLFIIVKEVGGKLLEHYTGHHSKLLVKQGQRVKEGQVIAKSGMSGPTSGPLRVTGPHVHYQVRKPGYGALVDVKSLYKSRLKWAKLDQPRQMKLTKAVQKVDVIKQKPYGKLYAKGSVVNVRTKLLIVNGNHYFRTRNDTALRKNLGFLREHLTEV